MRIRKPSPWCMRLDRATQLRVEEYMAERRISRGAALRELVTIGLTATPPPAACTEAYTS